MMRRPGIVLLTSVILSLIAPAIRAGASVEFAFHVRQTGLAEVFGSTCPFGDVTFTKDTLSVALRDGRTSPYEALAGRDVPTRNAKRGSS